MRPLRLIEWVVLGFVGLLGTLLAASLVGYFSTIGYLSAIGVSWR
jgi:hypothetical protein